MRTLMISSTIAVLTANSAFAQPGIDLTTELPGKMCLGTYTIPSPKGNTTDQGAVRISFATGSAQFQIMLGMAAYRGPSEAKFPEAEPVTALHVTAGTVAFARKGGDWKLNAIRREGTTIVLSGEADPRRGNPSWVVAMASLTCQ